MSQTYPQLDWHFLNDIKITVILIKLGTKTLVKILGISYLFQHPGMLRDFEGKDKIYTFICPEVAQVIEMICAKCLCVDAGQKAAQENNFVARFKCFSSCF